MKDETEGIRRVMTGLINSQMSEREALEEKHGKVYDTKEVQEVFSIQSFLAPFVSAVEKSTGKRCLLMFQHEPRYYWFDSYTR